MTPDASQITILDGPLGTELLARGVATPLPGWSAHALDSAPEVVRDIHRAYAHAGATVHTANTFRTQPRQFPDRWQELLQRAVELAREGLQGFPSCRLAGSVAPLADCYAPRLSPANPRPDHRRLVRALAEAGVDLLLVETFPNPHEARIAVEEAIATGLPTWLSMTPGPKADLMRVEEIREVARRAVAAGAGAVLVNCVPVDRVRLFLPALAGLGVPFGAYANAGRADARMGFVAAPIGTETYAELAQQWVDAGATILGSCCGTGVEHIAALHARFASPGRYEQAQ